MSINTVTARSEKEIFQELILQDNCSQVTATILGLLCFCVFGGCLFLNGIKSRTHQSLYHSVLPSLLMPSSYENLLLFIKSVWILQLYCTRTSHFTVYESRKQTVAHLTPHPNSLPQESSQEVSKASHYD